jgi:hypothetical protein
MKFTGIVGGLAALLWVCSASSGEAADFIDMMNLMKRSSGTTSTENTKVHHSSPGVPDQNDSLTRGSPQSGVPSSSLPALDGAIQLDPIVVDAEAVPGLTAIDLGNAETADAVKFNEQFVFPQHVLPYAKTGLSFQAGWAGKLKVEVDLPVLRYTYAVSHGCDWSWKPNGGEFQKNKMIEAKPGEIVIMKVECDSLEGNGWLLHVSDKNYEPADNAYPVRNIAGAAD